MMSLKGKVAVITGSTSGIGAEIARLFYSEGAKVVVTGRNESRGLSLAKQLERKKQHSRKGLGRPKNCSILSPVRWW